MYAHVTSSCRTPQIYTVFIRYLNKQTRENRQASGWASVAGGHRTLPDLFSLTRLKLHMPRCPFKKPTLDSQCTRFALRGIFCLPHGHHEGGTPFPKFALALGDTSASREASGRDVSGEHSTSQRTGRGETDTEEPSLTPAGPPWCERLFIFPKRKRAARLPWGWPPVWGSERVLTRGHFNSCSGQLLCGVELSVGL